MGGLTCCTESSGSTGHRKLSKEETGFTAGEVRTLAAWVPHPGNEGI
jgi:hypothetical protein